MLRLFALLSLLLLTAASPLITPMPLPMLPLPQLALPVENGQETIAAEKDTQGAEQRTEQVRASLRAMRDLLAIGLSNDDVGELLREARQRAPSPEAIEQQVRERERQVAEARLNKVRLLERQRLSESPAERRRLTMELATQAIYLDATVDALEAERALAQETNELVDLLDGKLLWIGSAPPVGPTWVRNIATGLAWLGNPAEWLNVGNDLLRRLRETPVVSGLITLVVGALLLMRKRTARRLPILAEQVGKYAGDSFVLTLQALAVTLMLALPLPLALWGIGGLLSTGNTVVFSKAIGEGLLATGSVYFVLDLFRLMCKDDGLIHRHFLWSDSIRRTMRSNLRWLTLIEASAALVVVTCDNGGEAIYRSGLGRVGFLVGSIGLTIFVARVFLPSGGVFGGLIDRDGWAWRLRKIWYSALVLIPLSLTLAAAAGYYYTATEVQGRFFTTGVVVLSGLIVYSMSTRWLLVARQRMAVQQARAKLAERREARAREALKDTTNDAGVAATPELDPQHLDVAAASAQTLTLLRTIVASGVIALLWSIWSDLVPALEVLNDINLVDPVTGETGIVRTPAITLWSVVMGLIAAVLTFLAARNLPAVLELVILQRFPMDAGTRYAVTTLVRYAVVAVGVLVTSNALNIDWSKAQWIVAALGVGLGFGLQEIVANFVSGLIILFERPIRVGDTVTVGDISGTVTKLQIRATTITDFENKEVFVPNKSFITDRVSNWTLSSSITRLLIPVGVAYGTNVIEARAAIAKSLDDVPAVLSEPAPSVLFLGFGDSSLNFEVRAFVGELSKRMITLHDLHVAINANLAAAGIEIPFPQRDLHLRSSAIGVLAPEKVETPADGEGS